MFIDWSKEKEFKFKCSKCKTVFKDTAIGEDSMESECPNCGKWNYSEKGKSTKG